MDFFFSFLVLQTDYDRLKSTETFCTIFQSFHRSIRQNGLASNEQKAKVLGAEHDDDIKKVSSNNTAVTQEAIDEKDHFDGEKATAANNVATSDVTSDSSTLDDSEKLKFRGFRNNILGTIGYLSCIIITILFLTFLGCIVGDYCKFFKHTVLIPYVDQVRLILFFLDRWYG